MRAGLNWKQLWRRNKGLCTLYIAECLLILCLLPGLFRGKGPGYSYTGNEPGDVLMELQLPAGIYEVCLQYSQSGEKPSVVRLTEDEGRYRHLFANEIFLNEEKNEAKFHFWLPFSQGDLSLQVASGEDSEILVESITVNKNKQRSLMAIFIAAVVSLFLDTGLYYRNKWKNIFFLLAGIVTLVSLPRFVDYCMDAERLRFHLLRIEEVKDSLAMGKYPGRTAAEPGTIFYGNLFLIFPALLRMIGFPVQDAWRILLLVLNVLTAGIAYLCFQRIFENRMIGVLGSMLYTWAPYRIYDMYIRAELGESMALCFLPLVCLGFYQIFHDNSGEKQYRWVWIVPALGFFGVQQSYFITFETAAAAFLAGAVFSYKKIHKPQLIALLKTALAVLVLNFDGLWRSAVHFLKEPPFYAADHMIQRRGVYLVQHLSVFNWTGSFVPNATSMQNAAPQGIGFALTCLLLLYLWTRFTGRYKEDAGEAGNHFGKVALWLGVAALLMSTARFPLPWDMLRRSHWTLDKLISDVQTPACMVPAALVCFVIVACQVLWQMQRRESRKTVLAVMGAVVLVAFLTTQFLIGNVLREKRPLRIYDGAAIETVQAEVLR